MNRATQTTQTEYWSRSRGADKFYDAFMENSQDARSTCVHCQQDIYLDIREGGGVPDWRTKNGDYGCDASPESTSDGVGSHVVEKFL